MDKQCLSENTYADHNCLVPSISDKKYTGQKIRCRLKETIRQITAFSLILILTLNLAACSGTVPGINSKYSPGKEYLEQLKLGDQALQEGKIKDALDAYRKAIELNPAVPQAYHRIFDTYVRDERYSAALKFAQDSFDKIDTEAVIEQHSENKEYTYKLESSEYDGMTASEELAGFLTAYLDLGCHYPSCNSGVYPNADIIDVMGFIEPLHSQLEDTVLSESYDQAVKIGTMYASIFDELEGAGINRDHIDVIDHLSYDDILFYTDEMIEVSYETIEAFEAKYREILDVDPDLLFVYRDIAALYTLIGDHDKAKEIYLESFQAMKDMKQRRSYVSKDALNIFSAALKNQFVISANKNSLTNTTAQSTYGFNFHTIDDSTSDEEYTMDIYLREIDDIVKGAENIYTSEAEKADLKDFNYEVSKSTAAMQDLIDWKTRAPENNSVPETSVEGAADLLVSNRNGFYPTTYDPDSGWVFLNSSWEKGFALPVYLVNVKSGKVITGQEQNDPCICSDRILQFKWIDRNTGELVDYRDVSGNVTYIYRQYEPVPDFYLVTYDLKGNVLEEKIILKNEELNTETAMEQTENAIASAKEGLNVLSNNNWSNIGVSFEGNDGVVQAGGVTLRKTFDDDNSNYMNLSNAFLHSAAGLLFVCWYGYGIEIYQLK